MGVCGETRNKKNPLNPEILLKEINNLFKTMKIRKSTIEDISEKVLTRIANAPCAEELKSFLKEQFSNEEGNYNSTIDHLISEEMDQAKIIGDETLSLVSLLFLSESKRENFINLFKTINLAKKTKSAGADVMNVINTGMKGGIVAGIVSGLGAIQNISGAVNQVSNPSTIRKFDLKNIIGLYINIISLLSSNALDNNRNECKEEVKNYYFVVLKNAFDKNRQKKYLDENFFNGIGQDEIKIEEFFGENLERLKNDSEIRNDLVTNYLNSLSKEEKEEILLER
jgi:hypothetical protein